MRSTLHRKAQTASCQYPDLQSRQPVRAVAAIGRRYSCVVVQRLTDLSGLRIGCSGRITRYSETGLAL